MSQNSPEVAIAPKRPYVREIKTINEKAKELLNERYKGERKFFRRDNRRYIIPFSQDEYTQLSTRYNQEIKVERQQRRNTLAKERRVRARQFAIENKESTFIIHMTLRGTYYKKYYDPITKQLHQARDVITWNQTTSPITAKNAVKYIPDYVANDIVLDDGYKTIEVLEYTVEYMNVPEVAGNQRNPIQQPMRDSYVLRNDWLQYSHGIAEYAYHATNNMCVYYQLTKFLLDPPTNRPTEYVLKQRTSEKALFRFFKQYIRDHSLENTYPEFTMTSGVSAELLAGLCNELGRNMYAYDSDHKLFLSIQTYSSKNYCPVVFYKMNGHCYMLNDKNVMRSVAESNKKNTVKIISSSVVEENTSRNSSVTSSSTGGDDTQQVQHNNIPDNKLWRA